MSCRPFQLRYATKGIAQPALEKAYSLDIQYTVFYNLAKAYFSTSLGDFAEVLWEIQPGVLILALLGNNGVMRAKGRLLIYLLNRSTLSCDIRGGVTQGIP